MHGHVYRYYVALLCVVVLSFSLFSNLSCQPESDGDETAVQLFYSADLSGYLEPCG